MPWGRAVVARRSDGLSFARSPASVVVRLPWGIYPFKYIFFLFLEGSPEGF